MNSQSTDLIERLRDRDAVVLSGLFHAIPTMAAAASYIEELEAQFDAFSNVTPQQYQREIAEWKQVANYETDVAQAAIDEIERLRHALKTLRDRIHDSGGSPRYFATPGAALNAAVELADTVLASPKSAPVIRAPQKTAERLPSSDAAGTGADTHSVLGEVRGAD